MKRPCIVTANSTCWVELENSGWNVVTGSKYQKIIAQFEKFQSSDNREREWIPFYGDGTSSAQIVDILKRFIIN
jgi:UDP-N-acetylglucosamine 2-epimerase